MAEAMAAAEHGRRSLPSAMRPRKEFSIWEFLKTCIGKELTKIAVPVHFNEPLTFLQRLCEYLEYWPLLKSAAETDDPVKRMELLCAFIVSGTSCNNGRLGKPFNPMLAETFELQHSAFRVVCEQVSHHPPTSAFHSEAADSSWIFRGSVTPKLTFWGKSVDVTPKGCITVEFPARQETYTWQNARCIIHNVIIGDMWIEQSGDMTVTNHSSGLTARLKWRASSLLNWDCHLVDGFVLSASGEKLSAMYGKWTECLYSVPVQSWQEHRAAGSKTSSSASAPSNSRPFDLQLAGQRLLWRALPRPDNSDSFYSFTEFTFVLNDVVASCPDASLLPPTDSRWRPDVRAMENGDLVLAGDEKLRLEDKQRKAKGDVAPRWFRVGRHALVDKEDWLLQPAYWLRDWSGCPDIF